MQSNAAEEIEINYWPGEAARLLFQFEPGEWRAILDAVKQHKERSAKSI